MINYFAIFILLIPSVGFCASFDCNKAATLVEMMICNDAELSRLDDELSLIYKQAKATTKDPLVFKQQTKSSWLWREKNCQTKACLVSWYTNRKLTLQKTAVSSGESISKPPEDDIEALLLRECERLALVLNKTKNTNININELRGFVTWRATCAEEPPAGDGNVMALCEGTSVHYDGTSELLFFWSKTNRGKIITGYEVCAPD